MMRVEFDDRGEPARVIAEVAGRYGVYLDTYMLLELARDSQQERGDRFVAALRKRGTLLFSETNAAEVGRLTGASAGRVARLLSRVGPYWVPLRLNVFAARELEDQGRTDSAPISEGFLQAYNDRRQLDLSDRGVVVDKSSPEAFAAAFYDLGFVVDWSSDEDGTMGGEAAATDEAVRNRVAHDRRLYDEDPASLDKWWPPMEFTPEHRLRFVVSHLMRVLIDEAKSHQIAKNDGLDFCHAVMATAYASVAALDKAWKRRVSQLPQSALLAKVFYQPEADNLVALLEDLVEDPPVPVGQLLR